METLINFFHIIINSFYDFYAPHICISCKSNIDLAKINRSKYICNKCLDSTPLAPVHTYIKNELIQTLGIDNTYIDNSYSLFANNEINDFKKVIYSLKYHKLKNIGVEFGQLLWKKMQQEHCSNYDIIIPVPIHTAKKRERSYNQSDYIGRGVSLSSGINLGSKVVRRIKYTKSQTQLNSSQRQINVANVYQVMETEMIDAKKILLVDDVLTTGSTLNHLAKTLKKEGVRILLLF